MPSCITKYKRRTAFSALVIGFVLFAFTASLKASSPRLAILAPEASSTDFAPRLEKELAKSFPILDNSMSRAAYLSSEPATPYNLTTDEARTLGRTLGCDLFVLIMSATLRRSASGRAEYYESYAAVYVVSTRTGRLISWQMPRFEAASIEQASNMLYASIPQIGLDIANNIRSAVQREISETDGPPIEEVPAENSPGAKGFRSPIPYRRIKPEYTVEAALYDVTATVEVLVDLDVDGKVTRTQITRWAGFGLDESVDSAVRKMNWRPAERNGKTLPMRFLLRYNFKKMDKEEG